MMKKFLTLKKKKGEGGFTLIETLVAVAILALAIAGPMYSANVALVAAQVAGQELTASYLAQEGIEYVRAIRDYEYLHNYVTEEGVTTDAWSDFLARFNTSKTYTVDPSKDLGGVTGAGLTACTSATTCKPLYLQSTGLYTQSTSGAPTLYTRAIKMTKISDTEEAITSTVSWSYHGNNRTVTVRDNLTSWQ